MSEEKTTHFGFQDVPEAEKAGLPQPVVAKIKSALNEALQSPDFRSKLEASGNVVASPQVDMAGFHRNEVAKYKKIVDTAKIEE